MYEIINDFYRFWKRFQVIIQQLLWLQEDLQCFHPKSGNEKKRVFRENTVLTARHPALSGMNESDQTFFVDIGKCFRYHTHYLILAETTSKNLCSDHSWKHQRDERDQRKRIATSARKTTFWTTLRKLAVIIHLRKIVPSGKSGFYRNHAFMCQEINLRKSHFYENFVFSKARNSGF